MDEHLRWEEVEREEAYRGPHGRAIDKVVFKMPDGRLSDYYLQQEQEVSVVFALTKDQHVILARQYRPGKAEVLSVLPGGGIKDGQTPEEAARAELLEETGYAGDLQFVAQALPGSYTTYRVNCFVATNCTKVSEQQLDKDEFIEVVLMPLEEFKTHVRSGKMTTVDVAFLGLDYLKLL